MSEIYKDLDKLYEKIEKTENENKRLHAIIKEAREKIENTKIAFDFDKEITHLAFDLTFTKEGRELLEILDKENKNE